MVGTADMLNAVLRANWMSVSISLAADFSRCCSMKVRSDGAATAAITATIASATISSIMVRPGRRRGARISLHPAWIRGAVRGAPRGIRPIGHGAGSQLHFEDLAGRVA